MIHDRQPRPLLKSDSARPSSLGINSGQTWWRSASVNLVTPGAKGLRGASTADARASIQPKKPARTDACSFERHQVSQFALPLMRRIGIESIRSTQAATRSIAIAYREPSIRRIELLAEDQAQRGHDFAFRFRRQRSEQYLTSVQTAAHFLRQEYGRPQHRQILLGRSDFFCTRTQGTSRVNSRRFVAARPRSACRWQNPTSAPD